MTFNERVEAVSVFGVRTRQARFLVTVMLHGGVCVPKQYARFAGIAYGHKVNVFFDKLVSMRYAVRCRCVHNRAAVYHVRYAPLYRAIGEPHSRNRKPVPAARVIDRLMVLDAVLSHQDVDWLATTSDKIGFFSTATSLDASRWPQQTVGGTCRHFPDHLPIGVCPTGRMVFVFLATNAIADDLKAFIRRHSELLNALPSWTVRLVIPPDVAPLKSLIENVARDQLSQSESTATCRALATGPGQIESEILPLSYRHLSPVIRPVQPSAMRVEEGEQLGEQPPARSQPPLPNTTPMVL